VSEQNPEHHQEIQKEQIRKGLDQAIQDLVSKRANLEHLPDLFGFSLDPYVEIIPVRGNSGDVKKFNIKKFVADLAEKIVLERTSLSLPTDVFQCNTMILPPDAGTAIEVGSGAGIEEKKLFLVQSTLLNFYLPISFPIKHSLVR